MPSVPPGLAKRDPTVPMASDERPDAQIAQGAGVPQPAVISWRDRCQQGGIAALEDEPRPGRPPEISEAGMVAATLINDRPPLERLAITHWPARILAAEPGISFASATRI